MSVSPIKPGGWGSEDPVTSFEMTALQAALVNFSAEIESKVHGQLLKGWAPITNAAVGTNGIGAVRDASRATALLSNGAAGGTLRLRGDGIPPAAGGDVGNNVRDIAFNGVDTYVAAAATNWAYRSTNAGTNWTVATTKPAATATQVVWGDGVFCARGDGANVYTSPTGDVWTDRSGAVSILPRGLAATRDAAAVEYLIVANQVGVVVSSDSGVNWAAGGALPDTGSHPDSARVWLTSAPVGTELLPFFLGYINASDQVRIYRGAADGTGWSHISTLPLPADLVGEGASSNFRLMADPFTGDLVAVMQTNAKGTWLFLSRDSGATWVSHCATDATNRFSLAMANGRIFAGNASGLTVSNYEGTPLS